MKTVICIKKYVSPGGGVRFLPLNTYAVVQESPISIELRADEHTVWWFSLNRYIHSDLGASFDKYFKVLE